MTTEILRTRQDGCYALKSNGWGRYLDKSDDPEATVVITQEQLEGFELHEDIQPIPADLWERWMQLCYELVKRDRRNLEVSCRFLKNVEDPSQYRIVIPQQTVTPASVRVNTFDKAIDIETGETIASWPPEGWRPCGSSHSHNTMQAFFSGTDDQYELGDPGMHIVVGEVDHVKQNYTYLASVTASKRRFDIEGEKVVDLYYDGPPVTYHPNVLDVIHLPKPYMGMAPIPTQRFHTQFGSLGQVNTNSSLWINDDDWGMPRSHSIYSRQSSRMRDPNEALVQDEYDAVLAAVEQLKASSLAHCIDPSNLIRELSYEIEDIAVDVANSCMDDDPLLYSV